MLTNFTRTALFLFTNISIVFIAQTFNLKDHLEVFLSSRISRPDKSQAIEHMSTTVSGDTSTSHWFQTRFTSLYESAPPPEEADFKALFLSTLSEEARVVYNHENISVDTFQTKLTEANYALARASVEWKDVVEIPIKDGDERVVAGVFVVTRSMKFRIRAGPAQRINHNIFSARIHVDDNAQPDGDGSRRRVSELFISSLDKAAPIHIQGIFPKPAPQEDIDPKVLEKKQP